MSRRRRNKSHKTDLAPRAEAPPAHRRPRLDRTAPSEGQPSWETARIGLQGAGHPPSDAPFEERMAPYVAVVDAVLLQTAIKLGSNVDVSFMKDDFARLIAERMLVGGMKAALSTGGAMRGSVLLATLADMVEKHGTERADGRRNGHWHWTGANGHGIGNGHASAETSSGTRAPAMVAVAMARALPV